MNLNPGIAEDSLSLCTVCGGGRWSFVRMGSDLYQPRDEVFFKLYRCLSCGQVMQNPLPTAEQLSKAYSSEYVSYRPAWKQSGWPLWKILRVLTTSRRLRRLQRYGKGKKLLEVGCGAGDFLRAAQRVGWEVKGVEYSAPLADTLRVEMGFDVRAGELKPDLWQEGSFDVVVLWSVLEHLSNPLEALEIACSYLKAGGVVLIQIPTRYGVEQGIPFRQYWAILELPRHLSFFGKECLGDLCRHAGMKMIVFRTPLLETMWCYFASVCNFGRRMSGPARPVLAVLSLAMMSILSFPMMALRAWRGQGTEAFAVAVKE